MLFIYVNLEEKPTINLCLKSMSCLLLFTSRARQYVNNGLMSSFLNYVSYARSCVAAKKRNMTKSKHDLANITISILVDFDKKTRFSISTLRSSQHYLFVCALQLCIHKMLLSYSRLHAVKTDSDSITHTAGIFCQRLQ